MTRLPTATVQRKVTGDPTRRGRPRTQRTAHEPSGHGPRRDGRVDREPGRPDREGWPEPGTLRDAAPPGPRSREADRRAVPDRDRLREHDPEVDLARVPRRRRSCARLPPASALERGDDGAPRT